MAEYEHFFLKGTAGAEGYVAPGGGSGKFRTPPRDKRKEHGDRLINQLRRAEKAAGEKRSPAETDLHFIPLTFQGERKLPTGEKVSGLKLDSIETSGVRISNVREEGDKQLATVAVPKDKVEYFIKRFSEYAEKDRINEQKDGTKIKKPYHQPFVEAISEIRLAVLKDYYTDSNQNIPGPEETIWWELWLEFGEDEIKERAFREQAAGLGIELSQQTVRFPEVSVILGRTSLAQLSQLTGLLNYLAEFRQAKIVAGEFLELPPRDQAEFVAALIERTSFPENEESPAVCILDTGVNRGHPLLRPALAEKDVQAWNPEWSPNDRKGHGTELAGLALFGPLENVLLDGGDVALVHRLESVKILPDAGKNHPPDYGPITVGSMAKAEAEAPERPRVFCLAITADDRDEWLPSLWSSALDQACSKEDDRKRLVFVSGGNLFGNPGENYPDENHLSSVQDPAQAWNVLTVGAFTEKAWIEDKDFKDWSPVAPKGCLSPASTTSLTWEQEWPIKPEVVLEGGNYAKSQDGTLRDPLDDLVLLTTRLADTGALLGASRDTSAATALAARMGAVVQASYPEYWPETIRGLLVHTSEWTPEMVAEFPLKSKSHKVPAQRLRCYGWGVPNVERALRCANNVATLVIQDSLQPYQMGEDNKVETCEMHFHELPFPTSVLQELEEKEVRMRVTLSYFVEPSPGRKGWNIRHRYASHGLRFDVKRPTEKIDDFKKQLTRKLWDESPETGKKIRPGTRDGEGRNWVIGEYGQTKGSIHSDWWEGTASQLAESGHIAVYPVTGWWRERPGQNCYEKKARYSLIITIETADETIPVYSKIAEEIKVRTQVPTAIDIQTQ